MDIKKDEAFELAFSKTNFYKGMVESLKNKDCPFESVFEIRNGKYRSSYVQLSHEIWQAAKAVPNWIDYEKQSPHINGRYQIFIEGEQIAADWENHFGFSCPISGEALIQEKITHWSALGEDPKEPNSYEA
ncbi:hypothetical protein NVV27_09360 [Acinetobacter radioresistens]|uniref:hypothetical protein n=1 Tax=Acinetobacter radioresistens TaxID=40216 RepID=UPI002246D4CB|nr:hypothetical protein [Acinetobacter radioresistens]MCX0345930.1 hypothetical protein [Acinetobacter radioresistens]